MMRTLFLLIVLAAASALEGPLGGQEVPEQPSGSAEVTGSVLAEEVRVPVRAAEVELRFAGDSTLVSRGVTDEEGGFRLEEIPEGVFFVRIGGTGYGTVSTQEFEVAAAEIRDLGELLLPVDAMDVEPITVSAERRVVTEEADRTSYNVGVMPGTGGASVTEALFQIAELEVDIDGRVTLRGEPVTIYIDGREAPMSGEALAMFLEQFPADFLQQIEVIDNPSARYDAEGTGGIVNLVTKEGVELGLSGSAFTNADTRGRYGVGGRGTLQRGEWTVDGGGYLRRSDSENSDYELRRNLDVDPAYLRRDGWSDRSGHSARADLEVRHEPNERSRIYVEGRISGSGDDVRGVTTTTHLEDRESPIFAYDRARSSDSRDLSFDLSAGFDLEWEPREQEFEVELELERDRERENSREEVDGDSALDDEELVPAELTLDDEDELETELSLEVDYERAWGDGGEIELGYDGERTDTDYARLIRLLEDPAAAPGDPENRGHVEREWSHSLYATLERRFGGLSAEAGLRAEHTDRRFELPGGEEFDRRRLLLFPSANLSYRLDRDRRVRLAYSRRVNRPGMSVLNPVDRSTDPLVRRVGNPAIEPQFTHRMSMHASWSLSTGRIRLSPHYSTTRNGWAEMTTVDDRGVSIRTYRNIAARESYGASLTYALRQRDGWRGNVSVSARQEVRDASNLDDRYSGSSLRLSSRVNLNGRITDDLSAQGNFSYRPAVDLPQGRRDARYRADLGLRYRMLDDRASVRLALRDPFGLRGSSSRLQDRDYVLIGRSEPSTRNARLSVSYAFGGGGEVRGRRDRR